MKRRLPLFASILTAIALLIPLIISKLDSSLENVQAVLDSQYWLTIHVLMVVGSYGVLILSGILGHIYLTLLVKNKKEDSKTKFCATLVLQTMYLGVALLITGTILGGIWAAQSWGRFWDWDPKESWALITALIYLTIVHLYRFKKIANYGLCLGSIAGIMAVSFTWYGVNYILGTGLHTYGFGSGGEFWYYGYLFVETVIITSFGVAYKKGYMVNSASI
jgi:ABC-type transport system involved in cytochrome c biogenesis permease subunit